MISRIKRESRTRIGIAWLLLITLMPLGVVKCTHHHDSASHQLSCQHHSDGEDNSQDSCLICHFTLSPFIQSDPFHIVFIAELLPYEVPVYLSRATFHVSYFHGLRAPPVIA